jgi:hypothetical protein
MFAEHESKNEVGVLDRNRFCVENLLLFRTSILVERPWHIAPIQMCCKVGTHM